MKPHVLGLTRQDWHEWLEAHHASPAHAKALIQTLHQKKRVEPTHMSFLPKRLMPIIEEAFDWRMPNVEDLKVSDDGSSKWITYFSDDHAVETVLIKHDARYTLCLSSQVGCALRCQFCVTGLQGWQSNFSTGQILSQVHLAHRVHPNLELTNVVFMGMGEPLLNEKNTLKGVELLLDDWAYGLAGSRVTISTVGIVPVIQKMHHFDCSLTVSLHAPNDTLRTQIMPINEKFPLHELLAASKAYTHHGRIITFAYLLLKDINDQPQHAKELIALVQDIPCKINLIQFNRADDIPFEASLEQNAETFRSMLLEAGLKTTIRYSKGQDVQAACGQLRTHLSNSPKKMRRQNLASS